MAIHFNHTILSTHDSKASAKFLAEISRSPSPTAVGPVLLVTTENGANLDYMNVEGDIIPLAHAFLTSESEFDEIFGRVRERELPYWADPGTNPIGQDQPSRDGRRHLFQGADGHLLEIIPARYGTGGWNP